jgi:hypothetical protein
MKEDNTAKWQSLAQTHEFLFGKKPSKNMKLENLEKKVNEEIEKRGGIEGNDAIPTKMQEILNLAKEEAEANDEKPAMICLAATTKGVHMALLGEGQDVAVMIATAMDNQPMIEAVVGNAAMMCQMRKQDIAKQMKEAEDSETPKTEA